MKKALHKNTWCLIVLTALFSLKGAAQDIHFSQFYETPLLRNPALAGIFSADLRLQAVYRNQWQSVTVPYQTVSVDGEFRYPIGPGNDFITFGGEVVYDQAGTIAMKTTDILPAINYHKSLSDDRNMYLSLGFLLGINQRSLDRSKVTTNDQFDGTDYNGGLPDGELFRKTSYAYFDGSTGISFNTQLGDNPNNNLYIGFAYFHFNKSKRISFFSDPSVEMMPRKVFSGGLKLSSDDGSSYFNIQADYSKQGPHTETIGGLIYTFKLREGNDEHHDYSLGIGGMIRVNDAFIPVLRLEMGSLAFGFSYDANISNLSVASNGVGGFELGIVYQRYYNNSPSKDAARCPRF